MSAPSTSPPLIQITAVTVFPDSAKGSKGLTSGELCIGPRRHTLICSKDGGLCQDFANVLELSPGTDITVHYKKSSGPFRPKKIAKIDMRQFFASLSTSQTQDLSVVQDGIRVVFSRQATNTAPSTTEIAETELSTAPTDGTLSPTTQGILEDCPRFRILVIGKSGVGKSSLIHAAFGIEKAHTSDLERGKADIEVGLESTTNERFILHDSLGFEPGDKDNYKTVKQFIQSRQTGALKDRLHAVWFCVQVPQAGGRLLEVAAEDFFRAKKATMGNVPLIVVYTKFDLSMHDSTMRLSLSRPELDDESLTNLAFSEAESMAQKWHDEINQFAGETLPFAGVSTKENHKHTLQSLIELTYRQVGSPATREARITSVVTLMAQRVDPLLKVQASIDVGRKRYWKALRSSPDFKGHTVWDCLSVIHADVVAVWNFNDPHRHLLHDEFKKLVVKMVQEIELPSVNPTRNLALSGGSLIVTVSAFLTAIANPAAPIVLPIVAGLATAVWLYDIYLSAKNVQQRFITYIVDLTHIMETLSILTAREHQKLTRRAIKLAFRTYYESDVKNRAHTDIQGYRDLDGRDSALDMIESLIKPERCEDTDIKGYYAEINKLDIGKMNLDQGEEWSTSMS